MDVTLIELVPGTFIYLDNLNIRTYLEILDKENQRLKEENIKLREEWDKLCAKHNASAKR